MKTRVVVIVLAALAALPAPAQVGVWKNYTSMQNARAIARENSVYWAATQGGLFSWNEGSGAFERLTSAEGLRSIDLTAVAVDKNGDVWTGTAEGILHVYSPTTKSWRYISDLAESADPDKTINSIVIVGDTALVATNFGLSVFNIRRFQFGDTYRKFGTLTGSIRVSVRSAAIFGGRIWATVSDAGQITKRIASASLSESNLLPPEVWKLQIVGDATVQPKSLAVFNGKLYTGTTRGLYVLNDSTWVGLDSLAGRNINAITVSQNFLAGAESGYNLFRISSQNVFTRIATPSTYSVNSIVLGANDSPVVGTTQGGIMTLESTWTSHFPNGPADNQFISVAVDGLGNVWGGSGIDNRGVGFYRYDGKTWKTFSPQEYPAIGTTAAYRVGVGCGNQVWIGFWGHYSAVALMPPGATRVDSAQVFGANVGFSATDPGGANTNFVVGRAVCDNRGNTYFPLLIPGNVRPLMVRTSEGRWVSQPVIIQGSPQPSLTNLNSTSSLAVDASNNLWVAAVETGNAGIARLRNRGSGVDSVADVFLNGGNGLPGSVIRCIVVDKENNLWVGTDDNGIGIVLDLNNPTRSGGIANYKPLPAIGINAIAVDALNQKWVATNSGAVLLSPDGTQTLAQYTVENTDGKIISNEIKDVAVDLKTGTVYFATTKGLASLTTAFPQPKADFDDLVVSPNPYLIPGATSLMIDGLVENSKVKILTIDGHLVRELQTPGGRIGFWDGKDERGEYVSTGVYLVIGYTDSKTNKVGKGKVAVVRK
jgi:ligand-binding sensor domain-containing protein